MLKKIALASLVAAFITAPAFAAGSNEAKVLSYGVIGTGGFGAGLGFQPAKDIVVRAEFAQYTKSYTKNDSDLSYRGDAKLSTQALYADYHPFGGAFRVTGGIDFGGAKANLSAQPNAGTYTLGGNTYTIGDGDSVNASIRYPSTMPYIGIGWGLGDFSKPGFRFGFDLGANIGRAKAQVTATGPLTQIGQFNTDLENENRKLNDDVDVRFFPIVKFSVGYAF